MGRKASRQHAFKILYQLPFHERLDLNEAAETYLAEAGNVTEQDREFIYALLNGTVEHLAEIDEFISEHAVGWSFDRIMKVDLALMRLAIYEMSYGGMQPGVAINEAVELAKTFGADESAVFVNGLLGSAAKRL